MNVTSDNIRIAMSQEEQKNVMLNILTDFSKFCDENDLDYFLDAGTLLGSVRHKGYIPWDDDIDVCMPRKDYDRFMELMASRDDHLTSHIVVERPEDIMYPFAKLADDRTILIEHPSTYPTEVYVYIDIFPKDYIKGDGFGSKVLCDLCEGFEWLQWFNNYSIFAWKKSKNFVKRIVSFLIRPLVIKPNFGVYIENWLIKKHNNHINPQNCKYVTSLVRGEFRKRAPKRCFENYSMVEFEGKLFRAPVGYDEYLRVLYKGDYMQLPPVEKRINHRTITYWKSFVDKSDFLYSVKEN